MKELLNTTIGSFGGISLFVILKFVWERLDSYIKAQQNLKREMKKEAFQSELRKKEYISKVRFDKEFDIYQELSEKNLTMVYVMGEIARAAKSIFYNSSVFSDEEIEEIKNRACNNLNDADFSNKKYAPFIDRDIYAKYHRLAELGNEIFNLFKCFTSKDSTFQSAFVFTYHGDNYRSKQDFLNAIIQKQNELSNLSDRILDEIRDYLKTLDVKE